MRVPPALLPPALLPSCAYAFSLCVSCKLVENQCVMHAHPTSRSNKSLNLSRNMHESEFRKAYWNESMEGQTCICENARCH